jgi:microcystin-dependent protein
VEDLTANVAEYVYTDAVASWLYLNGATVSRATYSLIFAKYGTTFGAGDGSTTFGLPDTRGRFPVTCGTNAACNLGDNDGVAEGSRQPKHTHAFVLNAGSHTHPATGLNITPNPHSHSQGVTGTWLAQPGTSSSPQTLTSTGNTSLSITGNTGPAGVSVGGSVGTGMAGSDAVAHIALGSIVAFIG